MSLNKLLYKRNWKPHYLLHVAFWSARYFTCILQWKMAALADTCGVVWDGFNSAKLSAMSLLSEIIFCYFAAYILLPKFFFTKKYKQFVYRFIIWSIIVCSISYLVLLWSQGLLNQPFNTYLFGLWTSQLNFITNGPLVSCMLFMAIRLLKSWYITEEEKIALLQENASTEIQLLKAQLHPHFFFNTLNNIYSFILNHSSEGPKLIQKLSMILKYISTHCDHVVVPLEKELQMIKDYINLEEIRYGDRLNMQINIYGNSDKVLIAPLLLMPFVENSFKHGASHSLQKCFIKMDVIVSDNLFKFYLENSIPSETKPGKESGKGIGLKNVQKRLALIYPAQHTLSITQTQDNFKIEMSIQFDNSISIRNKQQVNQVIFTNSNLSYANQ